MKKNLLITTQDLNIGGVETSLVTLLNSINYEIWNVDLVTLNDGILLKKINKSVNYINLNENTKGFKFRILKSILVNSLIKKYKNTKNYDVAIAYYGLNNYSDMYAAASNSKKKYIWVHNDFKASLENSKYPFLIKIRNWFIRRKFKHFDKIINVSNNCKKSFEEIFNGFNEKSDVIYNFLDGTSILEKSKLDAKIEMSKKFNICTIARLVSSKQIDKLLVIANRLKAKGYSVTIYIIGDGPEKEKLMDFVEKENLTNEIVFTGIQENPYSILKQADLFVSFSKYESLGLVILEAMVLNIPVVSLNNAGAVDIYNNIAPKGKCILIEEANEEIFEKIINKEIKFSNKKFDFNKYNANIKRKFKIVLGLDLK